MQNNPSPSLAIVIPVFNEVKVLSKALKSLHELNVDEIIFVDGGSTDTSEQLIKLAGFCCLQSKAGRAKQMNKGTLYSKSDIILYLHIDTAIHSSELSNIKKTYNQGFLSGRFNVQLSGHGITYRIISFFINTRSCLTKISTGDQGIFVTRQAYNEVGGIPDIALMEDIAFTKALKKVGKVACLKDRLITSSRRWEQGGIVKTILLMWKLRFLYWIGVSPDTLSGMYKNSR